MAIVTVYKMGTSTKINDFDLAAYKRMGWSTSPSGSSSPSTSTQESPTTQKTSSPEPTTQKATEVYVYKGNLSKNVPSYDVSYWQRQGWSTTKSSSPTPSTAPTQESAPVPTSTPSSSTPPAGATLIQSPSELARYTESQIWRDPNSDKIYLRSGEQVTQQEPVKSPEPTTAPETMTAPTSGLNTVGLLEAWTRKQRGTANEIDLRNLEYAQSKGWTPPSGSASKEEVKPTDTTGGTTGEIPGLNTAGLDEAYARKVAGTANATDLANLDYAMSKGWKPNSDLATTVTEADKANEIINAQQDADINARSEGDEVETRTTVEDIMAQIKESITPDVAAPEAPDYEQSLRDLRTEYGIDPLENQLNDLNKQLEDLYAIRAKRIEAEKNKTVATNVIEGRTSVVAQQEDERIAELERSINNVTNQLNTKYSVVNSLMGAKELDYTTAVQAYDAQMEENISLFNAAKGIQDELKSEEERAIDSARSSAQILVNGYMSAGFTFDDLTPAQQTTLTQLSTQSGFGADFYETVMYVTDEVQKDVLTHVISDDKAYATIIYKDGTTTTIPTGQPQSSNVPAGGSGGGSSSSEDKEITKFRSDAADLIEKLDNNDISWGTAWDQLHIKYPNASPQLIDQSLGGGLDPTRTDTNDQGYYGRAK